MQEVVVIVGRRQNMFGFCGFIDASPNKENLLTPMMDSLIHRGPNRSQYIDNEIAMGLNQHEGQRYVISFDGRIYNAIAMRSKLETLGYIFKSNTESEVLIHGYEEYGVGLLSRLRGMFSFVIWDKEDKVLFGARDFFGIKPLYYYQESNTFIYGSEIKSLLKHPTIPHHLNESALETYLSFQYSAMEETFFKGIFRLPPAHFFILKDGEIDIKRYWEPTFNEEENTLEHYVNLIDETIKESIKLHEASDVEVGSLLSSGVDSSYITSCFSGTKTFTVGFNNEEYNEISYAKALCEELGIENHHKIISPEEYWGILPTVQYFMDEPLADPAAVALYFVNELASKHVSVALSGEGADELFGGYNIYKEPLDLEGFQRLPKGFRRFLARLVEMIPFSFKGKNFIIRASKDIEERFIGNANIFSTRERKALLKNPSNAPDPIDLTKAFYDKVATKDDVTKMQYLDMHMWLEGDILLNADRMGMAHSLELRVPFLDKEVCKLATKLPLDYRVTKTTTKRALRLAAIRNLPEAVANKKKLGFPVPIRVWLREEKYYHLVKDAFTSKTATKYFNTPELMDLLDHHYHNKVDNSRKIWTVYMFLVWYGQFFANANNPSTAE